MSVEQAQRQGRGRPTNEMRREIDRLLLEGYGTAKVAEMVGISATVVKRARNSLIEQLRRRGECLSGCDAHGRRVKVKHSSAFISDQAKIDLEMRLLASVPVKTAARQVGIGVASAYRIRDALSLRLAAEGKALPPPKLPGRPAPPAPIARNTIWKRVDGVKPVKRVRRSPAPKPRPPARIADQRAAAEPIKVAPARPAPPRPSFEEILARVAAGAGIHTKLRIGRPTPAMTLGGVGSSLL